jgi:hypothetical protein
MVTLADSVKDDNEFLRQLSIAREWGIAAGVSAPRVLALFEMVLEEMEIDGGASQVPGEKRLPFLKRYAALIEEEVG